VKWPDLEAEVNNWIADNRNSGIWVARRVIVFEEGGWEAAHSIAAGTLSCQKR
jgi:hypothetical protein